MSNRGTMMIEALLAVIIASIGCTLIYTVASLQYRIYKIEVADLVEIWDENERCDIFCPADKKKREDQEDIEIVVPVLPSTEEIPEIPIIDHTFAIPEVLP